MIVASILTPLEDLLTWILTHLHDSVGLSWAWSIVALIVIVRMLLVPLTVRQIHSMQNLQAHAPEMKAIQQRWKHDRGADEPGDDGLLQGEPDQPGGVVPADARAVSGLHRALLRPPRLRERDPARQARRVDARLAAAWSTSPDDTKVGWGPLLIVLYAASQLTSSYLMSQNMQPAQRAMLLILPIAFIPFVLNFPSGLMLYWLTTNLWTTGQGLITRRLTPKPQPPPKRSSRTPPKDAPPPEPEPEPESESPKTVAAKPAGCRRRSVCAR